MVALLIRYRSFMHLFQHRFASHCCEKLFIQAAPAVTQELLHPPKAQDLTTDDGEIYVSMEDLFLFFFQLSLLLLASASSLFHFARHLGNTVMVDGGARWSCA